MAGSPSSADWHRLLEICALTDTLNRLRANSWRTRGNGATTPPREGSALLQGVAVCGVCGRRMLVRYCQRCTSSSVSVGSRQTMCIPSKLREIFAEAGEPFSEFIPAGLLGTSRVPSLARPFTSPLQ